MQSIVCLGSRRCCLTMILIYSCFIPIDEIGFLEYITIRPIIFHVF
uniref:Uncharacterized protein n=1 Tax=Arundo donax TaxID=35708 RepID=A0A0A8YC72_ARUDO